MPKKFKTSATYSRKDSDGFQIPERLKNDAGVSKDNNLAEKQNCEEVVETFWPISDSNRQGILVKKYSKTQLQSRCKLYKTIKTALENQRQKHLIVSPVFNQIHKGVMQENTTNSSYVIGLKEIIKLVFEGAGIPSVFTMGIRNWTGTLNDIEDDLNQVIVDLQDNNANIIQYYPLRPKKQGDKAFLEIFTDFFSELGEKHSKILENNDESNSHKLLVFNWLETLSKTPLRPLRHSGCVALNGVLRGLSKSRSDMDDKISRFRTQMRNESPDSKSYKSLDEQVSSYVELTKNMDLLIIRILNDFWIPRSQDISENVRSNCFETLSKGILIFPSLSEAVSNTQVPQTLSKFFPEETVHSNKISLLEIMRSILELEAFKEISKELLDDKELLKCLKNEIIISAKAPENHKEMFVFGELSINILTLALRNNLLREEYVDEIVDLLWITSSPPSSFSKIGALLAEFIDSSLFDGGITHDKVESKELIDLLNNHVDDKKLRASLNLQGMSTVEPSRIRSDLQTLLEFIHEFGKDYVMLTHRCVNAFWTKAPCVRDTRFLVEMLVATELPGQQLGELDEQMRKTLLLVLHSNISYIEDSLACFTDEQNQTFRNELIVVRYRALIAISCIMEYIEPLILIHEKNLDNLTILLSTFSTIVSLYCKLVKTKSNHRLDGIATPYSGAFLIKRFPLKKLFQMLNGHSDPRIVDGICLSLSPILNIDINNSSLCSFNSISPYSFLEMDENHVKDLQNEIVDFRKQLMKDFFSIGKNYLADTDNALYFDIIDEPKNNKSGKNKTKCGSTSLSHNSAKNNSARNSTIDTICKFRRIYGIIKYLTLDNVYLDNECYNYSQCKTKNSDMLSPQQGSGIPFSFEVLIEVLERSGTIVHKNSDHILVYQSTQLFCITLDILTTGYTHLVQDLLKDAEFDEEKQSREHKLNESIIEIYRSLRHKFSCTLIETIRLNHQHDPLNYANHNYCFDYLNILSISSIMVMFGLQGVIENNIQDGEEFQQPNELIEWKILDSDLTLIVKEYIYWTNPNRSHLCEENNKTMISSALIESFNYLITFSKNDKRQPYYLLYPNCRVFEPLDNIKDETFVTTSETLEAYKQKIQEFIGNQFAPGCILSLLSISSQYNLTSQLFAPVVIRFLMDVEQLMVNNYYLDGIKYFTRDGSAKDKLFLSNLFLESFLLSGTNEGIGIFTILLIVIMLSCIEKNIERTKIISKRLIPSFTSKIGWKKVEEIIKENSKDISKSIVEGFRFALIGEIHLPIYKNVITRNEIIEKSIKTKESIRAYMDLLTTQNAPGGGKTVLNSLAKSELNNILEEVKLFCDFSSDSNTNVSSYYYINETFDNEIKQFLDVIANFLELNQPKKNVQTSKSAATSIDSESNLKNKPKKNGKKRSSSRALDIYSEDDKDDDLDYDIEDDLEYTSECHSNNENSNNNVDNNGKVNDFKSVSPFSQNEEINSVK